MVFCELNYNDKMFDNRLKLRCADVGIFPVFSGLGAFMNVLEFSRCKNGPVPTGKYWIVDRPMGGIGSMERMVEKWIKTGNRYWEWFALYRQDGSIDDQTFVDGVNRGSFRLHPLRPDGTGVSDGCVTFCNQGDFYQFRQALLRSPQQPIPHSSLKAYGELNVFGMRRA
ncbi:DUF2778 domain-containing protein [Atlantibacter sp. RC6]|uniref:DUF2778 domain-containing protein n=1 Tax=Atlantibacter sp. RC6 TaxID=2587036 RepID=UPI001606CE2C|nr:DUF2778 domain-containing protein [Atlantibacter sp. RC6]MBB3322584.1 hypothetical protein [Atlantibacter sp. RC6]